MTAKDICSYCGLPKKLDLDHVFATCLFFARSNERSIKVKSCKDCNSKSQEGLLKTFFAMFDPRITVSRAREIGHPKSRRDLRAFLGIASQRRDVVYPEERLTRLFKKMFLGVRRHLLGEKWTFVPMDRLVLFSVKAEGERRVVRQLPLKVDGPNAGFDLPPAFYDAVDACEYKFRDFRFNLDEEGNMVIRYDRKDHGNELVLVGYILDTAAASGQ
jgi:hypothetical protein